MLTECRLENFPCGRQEQIGKSKAYKFKWNMIFSAMREN